MIFGKQVLTKLLRSQLTDILSQDTHVPRAGRDLIRKTLEDANVTCSVSFLYSLVLRFSMGKMMGPQFLEVQAQHAFIRDESSKGRWDAALTRNLFGMMLELFERTIGRDLGDASPAGEVEHVC